MTLFRCACFVACCLLSLASCSSRDRLEGYFHVRLGADPTTLDPAHIVDVTGGLLAAKLYNGLVRIGDNLEIWPDIAESWTVSPDRRVYTFTLKRGVTFSNNRPVKARDFKYSFERVLRPATRSPNSWVFEKILGARDFMAGTCGEVRGIRVIDDQKLSIELSRPFSPFLSLLTMTSAYVVPYEEVERRGADFSSRPVGTGPFVLEEWLPNRKLRFTRRDDYFDSPARVNGIVFRVIPEDLTAVTEFEIGNLDVLTIPASEYARYRGDHRRSDLISSLPGLNTYYIGFNCSRRPLDDPELRTALSRSIDREKILNTFFEQRGRLAAGPVPDILRRWKEPDYPSHDVRSAREYIEKKGYAGMTLNFYVTAEREVVDISEVIQFYMEKLGITVKIKQLEWSAYKEAINRGEPDIFYLSWWADYPDPENFLFPLFHSANHGPAGNRTRYTNPRVDFIIEQAEGTLDDKRRWQLYQMAEAAIVSDMPWIPLWHKTDFVIRQPWVACHMTYPIYSMDKGTTLRLR